MPSSFQLQDIRDVIRSVTSSPSVYQLTDAKIDDFINKFYQFVLPDEIKPFKLLVPYVFYTLANQVNYTFDLNTYISFEPEVFINGNRLLYYQDRSLWLRDFQYQYNQSQPASGNGSQISFTLTAASGTTPIVPGTVIVTDNVENLVDTLLDGTLIGSLGGNGSVDYETGDIVANFASAPPDGNPIFLTYAPIINGRPRALLYEASSPFVQGADGVPVNTAYGQITLSPIPDQSYRVEAQAYIMPTALLAGGSSTQTVLNNYWGYTIAYGASLEIFRQRGQMDQLAAYRPEYEYYLDRAQSRSTQQYSNQRSLPKW